MEQLYKNKQIDKPTTVEEKLKLLGGSSIGLQCMDLDKYNLPSFYCAAASWDTELMFKMSQFLSAKADGSLILTPSLNVQTNPFRQGLSEDIFLTKKLAAGLVEGVEAGGAIPIVDGCYIHPDDIEFMDSVPSRAVIRQNYIEPAIYSIANVANAAVVTSQSSLPEQYKGENIKILDEINKLAKSVKTVCASKIGTSELEKGNLFSLEGTQKDIDEQKLDVYVDRAISFINSNKNAKEPIKDDKLAMRACAESIVLLKNDFNALPLNAGERFVVAGDAASEMGAISFLETIQINKHKLPFMYMGYIKRGDKDEKSFIDEALRLSQNAQTALVFADASIVDIDAIALIRTFKAQGKKVVAICNNQSIKNLEFCHDSDAVLLLPSTGSHNYVSLLAILDGEINPSAKLTYSLHENQEEYYQRQKKLKDSSIIKIGTFHGYRRHTLEGEAPLYPFGHGLGYSPFAYSLIKASEKEVVVKIKNIGKSAGHETVQVYAGKLNSRFARSKLELKGFERIYLLAGQSKIVSISLPQQNYAFYDLEDGVKKMEGGEYMLYVGSSSQDIRIKKKVKLSGKEQPKSTLEQFHYIDTMQNIKSGGYFLQMDKDKSGSPPMKEQTKKIAVAAILMTAIVDLLVAMFASEATGGIIALLVLINLVAAAFFAAIIIDTIRQRRRRASVVQKPFSDIEIQKLFSEQFSQKYSEQEIEQEIAQPQKITADSLILSFEKTLNASGIELDKESVRSILCAIGSSNLVLMRGDREVLARTAAAVGMLFDTPLSENKPFDFEKSEAQKNEDKYRVAFWDSKKSKIDDEQYYLAGGFGSQPDSNLKLMLATDEAYSFIPPVVLNNCVSILVQGKMLSSFEPPQQALQKISLAQFRLFCAECVRKNPLSEERWKKLDKIEAFIQKSTPFCIDNKTQRRIESFACMSNAFELEGLLGAIEAVVLPIVKKVDGLDEFIDTLYEGGNS